MPRVLIAGRIHDDGMAILRARRDLVIDEMADTEPPTFVRHLPAADALLIRTAELPREALVRADRLKIVSRHGVGYDNIPVDALTAKGIPLAIVGAVHSASVAEHALFLMLAVAKQALLADRTVRTGNWAARGRLDTVDLGGRTLLIIGFGRIGRALAKLALALGMRVIAADPNVSAAEVAAAGATAVADWRAALAEADVISLHLPRLPATENMIGPAEFAAMKADAILVNTSRGGLVDEAALARALAAGKIAGAGIDVFDEEPPRPDNPLFASDRVILSPHIAGLSREATARLSVAAAENVLAGLDGRLDPNLVVNRSVLAGRVGGLAGGG
jgi:D-3-phosphoglycerate dehydrogenase